MNFSVFTSFTVSWFLFNTFRISLFVTFAPVTITFSDAEISWESVVNHCGHTWVVSFEVISFVIFVYIYVKLSFHYF